jgi:hypothetical protein
MKSDKKYTIKERKALKKRAWVVFSKWIRNRDNNTCITCGNTKDTPTKSGKKMIMNGGHYCHHREDFNERNIHTQCFLCNKIKKGNMRYYTIKMIELYGLEYVKKLLECEKEKPRLESAEFYLNVIEKYS